MTEISPSIWDMMCRTDFVVFVGRVMAVLEPGTRYEENWHIEHLAYRLENVRCGDTRRLMINMPPRSMKTITVSIAFAAWVLGHDPTRRIMCVTYSDDVARAQAQLFQRIVTEPWYRRIFPEFRPAVPNSLMEWRTSKGGYRLASSIGGSVLGRGADLIILDDPNKGQEIYSAILRGRVRNAWDHTISTRLNHPKESAVICVMQRLHADDLAGHLLNQEEWDRIMIPAIATEMEQWELGGGAIKQRTVGEVIQASRMGLNELDVQHIRMGATAFSAQYQQQPVPDDGIVIRRSWLKYYETPPDEFSVKLVSWDTASTLSEDADWSVGTVWGIADGAIYLLDVVRDRLEAPDLRHRIEAVHRESGADVTIVEDADLGRGIVQDLRRSSSICKPLAVKPRIEKVARMQARAVMFETGKIFLPRVAPWLATYLDELLGFPNRRHDDQVDSTSQALDYIQQRQMRFLQQPHRPRSRPTGRNRPSGAVRTNR